ncbi:MAG: hypothetical protein ACI9FW_001974 [Flavobacterium sp.]|jgi:hypothetical protein
MKKTTKITSIFSFTTCISKSFFYLSLVTAIILVGCDIKPKAEKETDVVTVQKDVHVAFAGGGWLAHTGHSAWIISLLDNDSITNQTTLKSAFSNVKTISSNSGGTWFSTMLMYSPDFVNEIQTPHAIANWDSSGWIGKQKKLFDAAKKNSGKPCSAILSTNPTKLEEALYLRCVNEFYSKSLLNWKKTIDSLVFRDYSLGTQTLSASKQPWATDKSLLIASSLLTNSVVLNEVKKDLIFEYQQYYQTCLQNAVNTSNEPKFKKDKTANCSSELPKDVAAVTFSSLPDGSQLKPLAFFRELDSASSLYNVGYTIDYKFDKLPTDSTTIQGTFNHGNVPVMTAAAASSAAAGYAASEHITRNFIFSYTAADEALSFKLADSTVQYTEANNMPLETLASNMVVRLADGGAVDNSGVAQLVSFLQKNNQADNFNIVAFDNVDSLYTPFPSGAKVGENIASLFGAPDTTSIKIFGKTYAIEKPQLQIFDAQAMKTTIATWYSNSRPQNGMQILYTKYNVKTIENIALGIDSNSTGTLHAFSFLSANAAIVPDRGDIDFKVYSEMLNYMNFSLQENSAEGLIHLKQAFGISITDE